MLNQYKEETSQIHAPADLILKTKQAVREEELRVQREQIQHTDKIRQTLNGTAQNADLSSMEKTNAYARSVGGQTKNGYGKVYKWALPVAAAVLFAILMNASTWMIGNRFAKSQSQSDTSSDMMTSEAGAGGAEYEFAEDAAAEEFDDMDAGMDKAFADAEFATESAAAADEDGADYDMYEKSMEEESASVTEETPKYDATEDVTNESGMSEDAGGDLIIEEVEEVPSFCDDQNTECINVRGLQFYVAREWGNQWKAYVSVDDRGYLITGSGEGIPDRKSFAGKAYELLAETVEGIE